MERACSSHGLSVPEALLQPDCHLGLSAAPGASPARSFLRPGACRAAAGEKLACRSVTSLLLLALVLGLERDSWAPGDTDGRGWGLPHTARNVNAQKRLAGEAMSPRWLILPVTCREMGVIQADISIIPEFYSPWALFKQKFCQYLVFGLIPRSSQLSGFLNAYISVMQLQKN